MLALCVVQVLAGGALLLLTLGLLPFALVFGMLAVAVGASDAAFAFLGVLVGVPLMAFLLVLSAIGMLARNQGARLVAWGCQAVVAVVAALSLVGGPTPQAILSLALAALGALALRTRRAQAWFARPA